MAKSDSKNTMKNSQASAKNLSMSGRPAGRVTLLRGLYLWNRKPDWQAVFFGG